MSSRGSVTGNPLENYHNITSANPDGVASESANTANHSIRYLTQKLMLFPFMKINIGLPRQKHWHDMARTKRLLVLPKLAGILVNLISNAIQKPNTLWQKWDMEMG